MSDERDAHLLTPVAIVGAGPVGLSLALGLARHGVRSVLLERKLATSEHSKAPGIHVRTREILCQWGIEERFLSAGQLVSTLRMYPAGGGGPLLSVDYSDLEGEADHPGILILEQARTEELLLEAVRRSGMCDVRFGAEAVGLVAEEDLVRLTIRENEEERSLEAEFVVGCDGANSFVRGALGLPFEGITYSIRPMLADVRVEDGRDSLPWPRLHNGRSGLTAALRLRAGLWRIIRLEGGRAGRGEDVTEEEMNRRVEEVLGEGPVEVVWASRFRIHRRSSPRFRVGRVLLAGDAAHVHSPAGGLGMNGGIQDAHNLAWKLAYALRGGDLERLLDSYEAERKAVVVGSVTRYTDLITRVFLQTPLFVREGAFLLWRLALKVRYLRTMSLRRATMIDLDYPPTSPLLDSQERCAGVRLPNPQLCSPEGVNVRLYDLLPAGPVILEVAGSRSSDVELPLEVIRIGPGGYLDPSGLLRSLLAEKDGWILVRPDGHLAWARDDLDGLDNAVYYALGAQANQARGSTRRE